MFMLIPFIGERKPNYNDGYKTDTVYSTNKVKKEKNTEGLELQIKLVDAVKNLPCTQAGTVENYFLRKTAIPAVKDLGWSTKEVENGYLVERTIQIEGLKSSTVYRWQVNSNGTATPVNGHAIGITKK